MTYLFLFWVRCFQIHLLAYQYTRPEGRRTRVAARIWKPPAQKQKNLTSLCQMFAVQNSESEHSLPSYGSDIFTIFTDSSIQGTYYCSMGFDSPLPSPKFRLGADCDAACAKRDERQFSKAAQARNCPKPRRDRAKSSKKKKTEVVANKNDV